MKHLKKLFSVLIILLTTVTVLSTTINKVSADTTGYTVKIDGADKRFDGKRLEFTHSNPVMMVSGNYQNYNAATSVAVPIKTPTYIYFISNLGNVVYEELLSENSSISWLVTTTKAELYEYGLILEALNMDVIMVVLEIKDLPDNKRPAISGEENFATNVDDAKPISFFQSYLSAWDETDGDVTDRIFIKTDNYTPNKSVLGRHKVVFAVDDLSGNEAELVVYINVYDLTKPVITGDSTIVKVGYKETYNIENFRKTLVATDNYDTLTNADIKLKTDGYTSNKTKLGTYDIVFNVKDSSNNEGLFTKKVQVYDNVIPTFSGPTSITTSNNTILTETDVRRQITATDEIDGNMTPKIKLVEDNYTGKGNRVGSYTIKYSVTDNAGNTANHTVTINRIDNIPPIIWIEDGVTIKTTVNTPLTPQQVIDILIATGQVSVSSPTNFTILNNEYTGNETTPGVYLMSIQARSTNGNESIHNMAITVLADSNSDGGINVNPPFNIGTFITDNWLILLLIIGVLVGTGYVIYNKNNKKGYRRRK